MKEIYSKPQMELILIQTELPLALSRTDGEYYEEGDETLSRRRRGVWGDLWGDLYALPPENNSTTWGR